MTLDQFISHLNARSRRASDDESGAAMVEFAIVVGLFFFIFFTLIDFGRLMYTYVHAESAAILATRTAVVRPPVCTGVPITNLPPASAGADHPRSGTSCDFVPLGGGGTCATINVSCNVGDQNLQANATVVEVWNRIQNLMPPGSDIEDLTFRYEFDARLGFLGGPYTPMVTVEFDLDDPGEEFQFVSPISGLATLAITGTAGDGTLPTIQYPDFSVSLPAEDLRDGTGS